MASTGSSCSVPSPDGLSRADVVIGIASVDSGRTLEPTIAAVRSGVTQYLDSSHVQILVADSGSTNGMMAQASKQAAPIPLTAVAYEVDSRDLLRVPYHG